MDNNYNNYAQPQAPKQPSKAKAIVSMVMGISSLVFAISTLILIIVAVSFSLLSGQAEMDSLYNVGSAFNSYFGLSGFSTSNSMLIMGFAYGCSAIFTAVVGIALGIVSQGLRKSYVAQNGGQDIKLTKIGKILSLVGIILNGVLILVTIILLASGVIRGLSAVSL